MATSSFTTVFKIPKKALREIAKTVDKPSVRFKLSEKDKESLVTSGERFQKWLESNKN
ncbi:hypothetical protein [Sphaerochaeta sp.]|jgi:hypothetical protein|uniref:Uncharacterized protein n=1 Tax=bioreactor metagenome TaxID=1076179 RepID=A0A645GDV8_9ZZZZ|nr:hypothetical protein [Sphaerochaeta sp.]MDD3457304.1 hypothetical protein [Sphaerochaeta sp.]MDX9984523.1 hypothetical protein [Sphaerochaeta sp.]